jgi:hypothetical protein
LSTYSGSSSSAMKANSMTLTRETGHDPRRRADGRLTLWRTSKAPPRLQALPQLDKDHGAPAQAVRSGRSDVIGFEPAALNRQLAPPQATPSETRATRQWLHQG